MRVMHRIVLILLLAVVLFTTFAGAPPTDIKIRLRVPPGINPVIVTDSDGTGVYKLLRVGQNAYKFVNADANVSLQVVQDAAVTAHEIWAIYGMGGANGPDPMPTIGVIWINNSGNNVGQATVTTLYPGQSDWRTGCDLNIKTN